MANPPEPRASNRPLIFVAAGVVLLAAAGTLAYCDELGLSGRAPAPGQTARGPTATVPVPPAATGSGAPALQPAQPAPAQAAAQAEAAAREAIAREAAAREAQAREAAAQAEAGAAAERQAAEREIAARDAAAREAAARESAAREAAAREAAARRAEAREAAARETAAREAAAEAAAREAIEAAQRAAAAATAQAEAAAREAAAREAAAREAAAREAQAVGPIAQAIAPPGASSAAPASSAPASSAPAAAPSFDIVRINPAGSAVIAGRAAPGAEIAIRDGGREIGRVRADERGEWLFSPAQPLSPGARELTLATPGADGSLAEAPGTVVLVVPEPGRDIAGRPAGTQRDAQALALLVPGQPGAAPQVLQVPPAAPAAEAANGSPATQAAVGQPGGVQPGGAQPGANQAPHPLALGVVEYGADGAAVLGGRAQASSLVRVYLGNRHIGDARADALGRWSLVPREAIPPGEHTLRLDQVAANGSVTHRVEVAFTRAEAAQAPAQAGAITVRPGQSLWRIARQIYGRGPRFIEIYQANRAQIRNPNLIYPGQVLAVPGPG